MKISIIVPVYNAESFIKDCIESLINQTYKDLEIIFVNDASTDNSLEILNEYARRDLRIHVINNERNLQLGMTRNRGLEVATGDYIHFLDADDYMNLNSYATIVDFLKTNILVDVLIFGARWFSGMDKTTIKECYIDPKFTNRVFSYESDPDFYFLNSTSACFQVVKRDFLERNNIRFEDIPYGEDKIYSFELLSYKPSIYCIPYILYNCRKNLSSSLTANCIKYLSYLPEWFNKSAPYFEKIFKDNYEKYLINEFSLHVFDVIFNYYKTKKISYIEAKKLLSKVDLTYFSESSLRKGNVAHTIEILKYNEPVFLLKDNVRKFIKKYFKFLFNMILKIKY